jgi:NhaA family Na+:H+ antiporter
MDALREFLHEEAAGGIVLLAATAVALVWANSPLSSSYTALFTHPVTLGTGSHAITESVGAWINDGLMALFFFVVGLEIKRELVTGDLREPRAAVLPAGAALGGALLPALLFLLLTPSGPASRGWGIPMATDIAFAVGVLALVGTRASSGAKLFLLSVAIVDDLIAIVVIAVYYTRGFHPLGLLAAGLALLVILAMRRFVASPLAYVLPALVVWLGVLESGVHATLAGVVLGLITPARPVKGRPVLEQLEHTLHPVSAFVVVPIFALANAGVDFRGGALADALDERLTWAVVVGLVLGKLVGIAGATFLLLRVGLGRLPAGMAAREVWPVAALGGIGFTVALFITDLAFTDRTLVDGAKVGIFVASIVAAGVGAVLLRVAGGGSGSGGLTTPPGGTEVGTGGRAAA